MSNLICLLTCLSLPLDPGFTVAYFSFIVSPPYRNPAPIELTNEMTPDQDLISVWKFVWLLLKSVEKLWCSYCRAPS